MKSTTTTVDVMFAHAQDAKAFNCYLKDRFNGKAKNVFVRNVKQPWTTRFIVMLDDGHVVISNVFHLLNDAGLGSSQVIHIYIIPEANN